MVGKPTPICQTGLPLPSLPAQTRGVAVRVQIPYGAAEPGSHHIVFDIDARSGEGRVSEKSVFLVPR